MDGISGAGFNAKLIFTATSSTALSISTALAPDIILLFVVEEKQTGTAPVLSTVEGCSPTGTGCSGSLVWRRRSQQAFVSSHTCFGGNFCGQTQEIWWANSNSTLSSHSISMVFSGVVDFGSLQGIGVNGVADPVNPWDSNSGLPQYKNRTVTNSPWVSDPFSTSQALDLLLAFFSNAQITTSGENVCIGWTPSTNTGDTVSAQTVGYSGVSSTQTSVTVSENGNGVLQPCDGSVARTDVPWMVTVDALTGSPKGGGGIPHIWVHE